MEDKVEIEYTERKKNLHRQDSWKRNEMKEQRVRERERMEREKQGGRTSVYRDDQGKIGNKNDKNEREKIEERQFNTDRDSQRKII